VRNAAIGPWIEIPFVNLVTKDVGMELVNVAVTPLPNLALSVYSSQGTVHADLEKNYCFIGLIL